MPDLGSLIRFAAVAYKSGDFQSAAEQLSICLKLSINGREIDQLTPEDSNLSMIAYLHLKYGQALLELARENENVLGEPIASKQAVNTSNYVNTEDSEVMCESEGLNEDLDEASDEDMEEMDINTVDLSLPIDGMAQDALKMASEICDDLQLAWEALDTSRILYQRLSMERVSVFLIDVYESLSEVCIESENWPGAHENLKLALETLTNNPSIPGSKRLMAEIHFKMALVSEYSSNFDDAIALLSDSKAILVKHQNELADVHEATELNDIILDINAKVSGFIVEFHLLRLRS